MSFARNFVIGVIILILLLAGFGVYILFNFDGFGHNTCFDETVFIDNTWQTLEGGIMLQYHVDINTDYDPPGIKIYGSSHSGRDAHFVYILDGLVKFSVGLDVDIVIATMDDIGNVYFAFTSPGFPSITDKLKQVQVEFGPKILGLGKLNLQGQVEWVKQIRDLAWVTSIEVGSSHLYLGGVDLIADDELDVYRNDAPFLIKIDFDGNLIFEIETEYIISGLSVGDMLYAASPSTPAIYSETSVEDMQLYAYDFNLQEQWVQTVYGNFDFESITYTNNGPLLTFYNDTDTLYQHYSNNGTLIFSEKTVNPLRYIERPFYYQNDSYYILNNNTIVQYDDLSTSIVYEGTNVTSFVIVTDRLTVISQTSQDILINPKRNMDGTSDLAIIQIVDELVVWETYFGGPAVNSPC